MRLTHSEGTQAAGEFSTESDEDLLVYIAMRGEKRVAADAAFTEFYNRHVAYLYGICRRIYCGLLGDAGVVDLVQAVFLRVYDRADTYDRNMASDQAASSQRVRAWMGMIAANILRSSLRHQPPLKLTDDLDEKEQAAMFQPSPDWISALPSLRLIAFCEALDTLSEKERDVLIVWAEYYRFGSKFQRLPDDISASLAERWNTTPGNVRQIRKRAIDKIRKHVETCTEKEKSPR
jgi:RNA polymerase sigma factor (sigma-70 family)